MTYKDADSCSMQDKRSSPFEVPEEPQSSENLTDDKEGSFGYSQKFFHISDGNLYSVFSPIQGRSYGVKPSFLRKHRCTVKETKGKKERRRNMRKGLKFHNFIPSESITSERDDGSVINDETPKKKSQNLVNEEVWKCRLQEEHGTKQITVANWSSSTSTPTSSSWQNKPSVSDVSKNITSSTITSAPTDDVSDMMDITSNENYSSPPPSYSSQIAEANTAFETSPEFSNSVGRRLDRVIRKKLSRKAQSANGSPSVLKKYLESGSLSVASEGDESCRRNKRKPFTTRRVVPYTKYLSMLDESPLDLSSQKLPVQDQNELLGFPPQFQDSSKPGPDQPVSYFYPQPSKPANNCSTLQSLLSTAPPAAASRQPTTQDHLPFGYMSLQTGPVAGAQPTPSKTKTKETVRQRRKPSQRTLIRQKLEDTFKQNGFLVKTKQVSDGDATFCKFKQLRKYTRYYLKSWHEHLPEEVHKLWKGFLPPNTQLNTNQRPASSEAETPQPDT